MEMPVVEEIKQVPLKKSLNEDINFLRNLN